jgi:hypothetical protein
MSPPFLTGGIVLAVAFTICSAAPAQETATPAEAAAELFFARPFYAMRKAVTDGAVTYFGDEMLNDPDRAILSVVPSRVDPCLFEAFYAEGFKPGPPGAAPVSYVASIDLRRPSEATINETPPISPPGQSAPEKTVVLRGPRLVCYRAVAFDPAQRVSYSERCDDENLRDEQDRMPRFAQALNVLRQACRW